MKNPELIGPKEAEQIGKPINPNSEGCDRYERVYYAHPSMKKGCAGCRYNRFTFCVAPLKLKREIPKCDYPRTLVPGDSEKGEGET